MFFFQLRSPWVCLNKLAALAQTGNPFSGEGTSWASRSVLDGHPLDTRTGEVAQRGVRAAPCPPSHLSPLELDASFGTAWVASSPYHCPESSGVSAAWEPGARGGAGFDPFPAWSPEEMSLPALVVDGAVAGHAAAEFWHQICSFTKISNHLITS